MRKFFLAILKRSGSNRVAGGRGRREVNASGTGGKGGNIADYGFGLRLF